MNIILWIGEGANQKALANKIHEAFPVAGIVKESRKHKPSIGVFGVLVKIIERIFLPSIGTSWWNMQKQYNHLYPDYPDVNMLNVENINSDAAFDFSKALQPDLIIVSGTRLVKEKMLSLTPQIGIINLHTGLSPYVKGGPNCTNWCIATKEFHLIGNTIMWIDAGIDTGNIITTEFTPLSGDENLSEVHLKVMEHAHALYIKAVKHLSEGHAKGIQQSDIATGKTYYTREWTLTKKMALVLNVSKLKQAFKTGTVIKKRAGIVEVKLD